jgi:diguanylate cyclase (GGDEF)-like protein/PAS domain S-box-containing protein
MTGLASETGMLQAQLFRYAQDMQELMEQHAKLQRHHQLLQQAMGRNAQEKDLLSALLRDSSRHFFVTDARGTVLQTSVALCRALGRPQESLVGTDIASLLNDDDSALAQATLLKIAAQPNHGGLELRQFRLGRAPGQERVAFDALVLQVREGSKLQLHWLLKEADSQTSPHYYSVLQRVLMGEEREEGIFITDPHGTICAVNPAFTRITGYTAAQVLGKNPRMWSAGRHDSAFYQDFWLELLTNGHRSGEVFNRRENGQLYLQWLSIKMVENHEHKVIAYVAAISDLSRRERDHKQLEEMAFRDELTGLPNRRWFEGQIGRALTSMSKDGTGFCVLFMDLDKFKPINDELGHDVGDRVLQAVAQRIQGRLREGDAVARIGGDEFVVLLQNAGNPVDAENVANNLLESIALPIAVGSQTLQVGASIGCAIYPRDGADATSLLRHADAAMYGAKRFGTQFSFFDTGVANAKGPNLAHDIWNAVEGNQLSILYQPQVSLRMHGTMRGCEALLRWNHPVLGEVPPSVFIPIAEKTGAIVPIGKWVLQHACAQLASWAGANLSRFSVSVNISLQQLRAPDFVAHLREQVLEYDIAPSNLELELSESQAQLYLEEDTHRITTLRDIGVRIAIKDFGLAFSTLSRLSAMSISSLKIDPKLVRDLTTNADARAISNCMVAVGRALNIDVIAEGVESAEQLSVLTKQGCPLIQGFFTGRPMPAADLSSWALEQQGAS